MREFVSAIEEVEAEDSGENPVKPVEFKLDGRVLTLNPPTDGQLVFMMAAMGRGQANHQRLAAMVNVLTECLGSEDQDYFEGRLLTRDPKERLSFKTVEEIFEMAVEEWFGGTPTGEPSASA